MKPINQHSLFPPLFCAEQWCGSLWAGEILQSSNVSQRFIFSKNTMPGYKSNTLMSLNILTVLDHVLLYITLEVVQWKELLPLNVPFSSCNCFNGVALAVSCRWRSAERAVLVIVPCCGGHLLLGPLHLCLPHVGLPLLQEGQNRLQGESLVCAEHTWNMIWNLKAWRQTGLFSLTHTRTLIKSRGFSWSSAQRYVFQLSLFACEHYYKWLEHRTFLAATH